MIETPNALYHAGEFQDVAQLVRRQTGVRLDHIRRRPINGGVEGPGYNRAMQIEHRKIHRLPLLLRIVRTRPRLFVSVALGVVVTAGLAVLTHWRLATRLCFPAIHTAQAPG